jgi:nicotinate-nucleotide pyrophosphorylase (carboxylating)
MIVAVSACVEPLRSDEIQEAVRAALAEDIGPGDATTNAIIPGDASCAAVMKARESLLVCGLALAEAAFFQLSATVETTQRVRDGAKLDRDGILMRLSGSARALLTAERVALNFVQRLSGIATLTGRFVEALKGTTTQLLDTRKTTPGWRKFEKYAVACGGGQNHRFGLYDMVLIKDNHLAALRNARPNPVAAAVERARATNPKLKVEVEADDLAQVDQALAAGADIILLDNMSLSDMRLAVQKCKGRAQTEASGGVTLDRIRQIADTGVDFISAGALTHSARAADIGLDFEI